MRLSACVDSLCFGQDIDFNKKVMKVSSAGISTIEFWSWWDKDIDSLIKLQSTENVEVSALCTKFISLVDSSERKKYIEALKETIAVAKKLNAKVIISQVGNELPCPKDIQIESLIAGLKESALLLEDSGLVLAVEPLNIRVNHKGYFLTSSDLCVDILKEVNSKSVKMLFDIYHQQITEGDICRRITEQIDYIAHFHIAGNPGRHELYNSELNNLKIFETIQSTGYDGCVGLEYYPEDDLNKGLEYALNLFSESKKH